MSIVRFLEIFIFRDILSYLVPGTINLFVVVIIKSDINLSTQDIEHFVKIPVVISVFALASVCYTIGYLGSTLMFILRNQISFLDRPKIELPNDGIMKKMVEVFGDWIIKIPNENAKELVPYCLEYVQINTPEIYLEKIERRVTLRNFEVGLAFTSLLYFLAIIISYSGLCKLYALIPLITLSIFLYGSRYTDSEIDKFSFRLFFNSILKEHEKQ